MTFQFPQEIPQQQQSLMILQTCRVTYPLVEFLLHLIHLLLTHLCQLRDHLLSKHRVD